ncbi:hypothetical protein PQX77_015892 [Marasmius sp. AFHP31]|nr:hypothetical protein PQX77_015892 [Marasmius sp. AFHP31]
MENDTIPISQSITVAWHRDDSTEPFDIALVYLKTDDEAFATQTLASNVETTRKSKVQHGTVTFAATATGKVQLVAVKSFGPHTEVNTFFTAWLQAEPGPTIPTETNTTSSSTSATITESSTSSSDSSASSTSRADDVTPSQPRSSPNATHATRTSKAPDSTAVSPASPTAVGTGSPEQREDLKVILPTVIGGCTLILAAFIVWLFFRRRQRRRKNAPSEEFRREMMALTGVDPMPPGNYHQAEYSRVKGATENDRGVDPTSSTTPLREDFEGEQDNGSSYAISSYSRTSAGTRALSSSGCLGTSTAISDDTSEVPMLPLIPISSNLTLSSPEARAPFRAMTDRQMEIEQKIIELQGRLIATSDPGQDKSRMRAELMGRIEKVKNLRESDWAYGAGGKVPSVLNE